MSTVFSSTQSHINPTSHRAQIPSSSDEVSSDGSKFEFARSNDHDDNSSCVDDQQEQGGVCNQGEGVMDVDLEEGVAEVDVGLQSSNMWNEH